MGKNVTIPLALFNKIIDLLDSWDIYDCSQRTQEDYFEVVIALAKKQHSIELRNIYAQIINAENDDERHDARMQYLLEKRHKYGSRF
jgi:uncharacterized protein YciU (UPF0263 family)